MSCESSTRSDLSSPGPTATIASIAPTRITLYSTPCFTSFGAACTYPRQNKYCNVSRAVGAVRDGEQGDRRYRYRKIGPGSGTYSRIGDKLDGFKPSS